MNNILRREQWGQDLQILGQDRLFQQLVREFYELCYQFLELSQQQIHSTCPSINYHLVWYKILLLQQNLRPCLRPTRLSHGISHALSAEPDFGTSKFFKPENWGATTAGTAGRWPTSLSSSQSTTNSTAAIVNFSCQPSFSRPQYLFAKHL